MNPGKVDKKIDAIYFAIIFEGWVKPFTAYPPKEVFWTAEVFPGLTMKNYVLRGRDTIEKDVWNASLIPTYSDFKLRHGVRSQTKRYKVIILKNRKFFAY